MSKKSHAEMIKEQSSENIRAGVPFTSHDSSTPVNITSKNYSEMEEAFKQDIVSHFVSLKKLRAPMLQGMPSNSKTRTRALDKHIGPTLVAHPSFIAQVRAPISAITKHSQHLGVWAIQVSARTPHTAIIAPRRGSPDSAGYDLFAPTAVLLPKGKPVRVSLYLSWSPLPGLRVLLLPRSSLGMRGVQVLGWGGEADGLWVHLVSYLSDLEVPYGKALVQAVVVEAS